MEQKKVVFVSDSQFNEDSFFYPKIIDGLKEYFASRGVEVLNEVIETPISPKQSTQVLAEHGDRLYKTFSAESCYIIIGESIGPLCNILKRLDPLVLVYFVPLYSSEGLVTKRETKNLIQKINETVRPVKNFFSSITHFTQFVDIPVISFHPYVTEFYKRGGLRSVTELTPRLFYKFPATDDRLSVLLIVDRDKDDVLKQITEFTQRIYPKIMREVKQVNIEIFVSSKALAEKVGEICAETRIVVKDSLEKTPTMGLCLSVKDEMITFDSQFFLENQIPFVMQLDEGNLLLAQFQDSLIKANQSLEVAYKLVKLLRDQKEYRKYVRDLAKLNKIYAQRKLIDDQYDLVFYGE